MGSDNIVWDTDCVLEQDITAEQLTVLSNVIIEVRDHHVISSTTFILDHGATIYGVGKYFFLLRKLIFLCK